MTDTYAAASCDRAGMKRQHPKGPLTMMTGGNRDLNEPGNRHHRLALEDFLPYRLARAAEVISRRFAAQYKASHGLTRPEWRALATIGQFGSITATEIGTHSSMHKTKVSRAIQALEKRKWIVRETDSQDRRIERIELTREGRLHYADLVDMAREFQSYLIENLGKPGSDALESALALIEDRLGDW